MPAQALAITCMLAFTAPVAAQLDRDIAPAPPAQPTAPAPAVRTPAPADLPDLVANLAATDLAIRRSAMESLATREDISLKHVEQVLRTHTLTPEQHRRLITVAWHRFRNSPRPAMGVRTNFQARGAVLESVTRGFPAERVLRPGDRIESADGFRLDDFATLRLVILSREPGDEMSLGVARDGAMLNLKVTLGNYEDLKQQLPDGDLIASFRRFRARDYYDYRSDAPIEHGVEADGWSFQHANDVDEEWSRPLYGTGEMDPLNVAAGGEPRGGKPVITTAPRHGNARAVDDREELRLIQAQAAQIQAQINRHQMELQNPRLDADTRRVLRQTIELNQARMRMLERQIQLLNVQRR